MKWTKSRYKLVGTFVVALAGSGAMGAWTPSGSGEFNDSGNWAGGTIDGQFTEGGGSYTGTNTVTFNADATLANGLNFNYAGSGSFKLSAAGVTATTVTWTTANTFTFASPVTLASNDVIQLTSGSPLPVNTVFTSASGWQSGFYALGISGNNFQVRPNSGGALTFAAHATNSNSVFRARVLTLGGDIVFNATNAASQVLTIGAAGGSTDAAVLQLSGNRTVNVSSGDAVVIRNVITQSGSTRKLVKTGAGTLELGTGVASSILNSTFSGGVDLNAGTLRLAGSTEASAAPTRGVIGTGTLRANGGGLEFVNQQDVRNATVLAANLPIVADFTAGAFSLQLNAAISGMGNLLLDGKGAIPIAGTPEFRLRSAYTYTGNLEVTNHLTNSPGTTPFSVSLEAAVPGNVTVSGSNIANGESRLLWRSTFSDRLGNTSTVTLNDYSRLEMTTGLVETVGTLVVNDTNGPNVVLASDAGFFLGTAGTANGKIHVRNGGVLAGKGIVDTAVVASEVGGTVVAGSAISGAGGTTGMLTISGGLLADAAVSFAFNFNGPSNLSTLSLTGASDDLTPLSGQNVVNLYDMGGGPLPEGTYTLISGIETGGLSDFSLAALPAGWTGSLAYDAGNLNFVVEVPEPTMIACASALSLLLMRRRETSRGAM